jgi:hypothetical protein
MMVTPFLFSGAIPVFDLTAPVFSGRQLLWPGHEVKRLRDNSRHRFRPASGCLASSEAANAFPL